MNPNRFVLLLLALAVFAIFVELGRMDVVSDNEGQRAAPPAEMLRSDNYLIPTINGLDYLAKPPLLYWAIAGVYRMTGQVSPLTARIPTALTAIALVLMLYFYARREAGEWPARWAALALLASPYFLERARLAELDVPLVFACFIMMIAFRAAHRVHCPKQATLYAAYTGLALGAAVMLKGPVPLLFLWAAWIALLLLGNEGEGLPFRRLLQWTAALVGLEIVVRLAELSLRRPIGFPIALVLAFVVWTVYAFRYAGNLRRSIGVTIVSLVVGLLVATPWAILVVITKGWPYITALLHEQVVERTYTASRINSGSPFYFVQALPVMLAPWGFLLPLQFSPTQWRTQDALYRFSVLTGWLSVLEFSLIAGKEYEYILPAAPFLLIAAGYHLAELPAGLRAHWMNLWGRWWQRFMLAILLVGSVGAAIYATATEPYVLLMIEVWILAGIAVAALVHALQLPIRRTACIFAMALCTILIGLLQRSYYYTGTRSPQALAQLAGDLVREGYSVEATKVYPAFAFYAETPIPVQTDPEKVKARLAGAAPYYYVAQRRFVDLMAGDNAAGEVLTDAYTNKHLVIVGNRPLP